MVVQTANVVSNSVDVKQNVSPKSADNNKEFSDLMSKAIEQNDSVKGSSEEKTSKTEAEKKNNLIQNDVKSETADESVAKEPKPEELGVLANLVALVADCNPVSKVDEVVANQVEQQVITEVAVNVKPTEIISQETQTLVSANKETNVEAQTDLQQQFVVADEKQQEQIVSPKSMPTESLEKSDDFSAPVTELATEKTSEPKEQQQVPQFAEKSFEENLKSSTQTVASGVENAQQDNLPDVEQPIKAETLTAVENESASSKKSDELKVSAENVTEAELKSAKVDFAQSVNNVEKAEAPVKSSIVNQVVNEIKTKFNTDTSEFSFNLNPKELGKIEVKMAVENGMLVVEIAASSEKTQGILAANSAEIKSMLEANVNKQQFVDATANSQAQDYLKDNNQNQRNNQGREQESQSQQNPNQTKETSTADFLSVMQMVNMVKATERW